MGGVFFAGQLDSACGLRCSDLFPADFMPSGSGSSGGDVEVSP